LGRCSVISLYKYIGKTTIDWTRPSHRFTEIISVHVQHRRKEPHGEQRVGAVAHLQLGGGARAPGADVGVAE
jgi:hypothetical protein